MTSKSISPDTTVTTPEAVFDRPAPSNTQNSTPTTNRPTIIWSVAIVGALLVGSLGGFAAGMQFSSTGTSMGGSGSQTMGPGSGNMSMRGGMGTVTAVSESSITIKDQMQNSDVTYDITSSTTVSNDGANAQVSDIQVGDTVMIRTSSSTKDSSGSSSDTKTAVSIELNLSMQGGPGGMNQSSSRQSTN